MLFYGSKKGGKEKKKKRKEVVAEVSSALCWLQYATESQDDSHINIKCI